ncbi:MAG: CinA family nicotinamide mononucleotide deamidase-related protein [Bacteroidota bacterium]|nr:CinA family nicotinamide mononucleotide deamidase-related protein [Bacteroidota bacterium]
MKAALLIIGDEILNGETRDTNSGYAAQIFTNNNIPLVNILTVSDSAQAIHNGLNFLLEQADLVITSGGLGPTRDDLTAKVLAEYYGCEMIFNESLYKSLSERYEKLGRKLNDLNKSQAMIPAKAIPYHNPVGTAPALWFQENDKVVICLPGVPSEMRFLLENVFLPAILEKYSHHPIVHKTIHTVGIAESNLAEKLAEVENKIEAANTGEAFFKLAYLPDMAMVKLRIIATGPDESMLKHQVENFTEDIKAIAKEYIFGYDKDVFATHIGHLLRDRGATLSTAESCTGGYLAHQITSVTGSADYFMGSVVSYHNDVKIKEVGVSRETLNAYGAVSEETAMEMLEGTLKKFKTDYALVTTGIAGPTGGEQKAIGTVYIGVGSKYKTIVKKYNFDRDRLQNIHLFTITALDMLRRFILGYKI